MHPRPLLVSCIAAVSLVATAVCAQAPTSPPAKPPTAPPATSPATPSAHGQHGEGPHEVTPVQRPDERHLRNVRQLTFGGENAEAYFDQTGSELIFQTKRGDAQCDAIFRMSADGKNQRQVSVGGGRTTCSFIRPDGKIIYSSTHGDRKSVV